MKRFILPIVLLCLTFSSSIGQVKKGFKFLKNKQYVKAEEAFNRVITHPIYSSAALIGIAKLHSLENSQSKSDKDYFYSQLLFANNSVKKAEKLYQGLNQKTKKKYRKYKIFSNTFTQLRNSIQTKALKIIKNDNSINKLESFEQNFEPLTPSIQRKFDRKENKVLEFSIQNLELLSYSELTLLVKKHQNVLIKKSLKFKNTINARLWSSFVKEFGYGELDKFIIDHPKHWASSECWLNEFVNAVNAPEKKALIQFIKFYPYSIFGGIAHYLVIKSFKPLGKLSEEEEEVYIQLNKEHELSEKLVSLGEGNFEEDIDCKEIIELVQKSAPSKRAYDLMQQAVQYYLKIKEWDKALKITEKTELFFPDGQPDSCDTNFKYYHSKEEWYIDAIEIFERPTNDINLIPLTSLNTPKKDETSPVILSNGQELYFAANGYEDNVGGSDIYLSKFDKDLKEWSKAKIVKELSSEQDEAPLSLTSDGKTMLIFRDGKLYLCKVLPNGWSTPKELSDKINSFAWLGRAVLSADGNTLIFAASNDIKESFYTPKIDIYVSLKNPKGEFGIPFSIGENINTEFGQERSPFLHLDMKTLYFSSDGHGGLGGTDVFMSTRLDSASWTSWSKPINLGKEINTLENDWGYNLSVSASSEIAYLSSDDLNWSYQSDLYSTGIPSFARALPKKVITAILKRSSDRPILGNTIIILRDSKTKKEIARVTPRPDGSFIVPVDIDITQLDYEILDNNALPTSGKFNVGSKEYEYVDEHLDYISKEDLKSGSLSLSNILFESGKSELLPNSYNIIEKLYQIVKVDNEGFVQISGHTDNEGNHQFNMNLSKKRALAVKAYLVKLGLDAPRIRTQGYGFTMPIADNKEEKGKALNRRVEVQIVMD